MTIGFIDDGYTVSGYVKEAPGLHAAVAFTYRAATAGDRAAVYGNGFDNLQADKKVERVAAFLAKAIKNWDLKNAKGEAVPHDGATLRKLPVTLYDRLQAIVFQLEPSDSQPSHESSDETQSVEAGAPNS
jgi:hypothetical protein